MHLVDGIIPLSQAIIYWIIAIIAIGIYFFKYSHEENRLITTAILAAATVVISSISIPTPFGVSIHFFIIPLVVIILGPLSGTIIEFITLLIQYFIFGMGGLTVMGANLITMGITLPIITYIFYKLFQDINQKTAIIISTITGIIAATFCQIIMLIIAGTATPEVLLSTLLPFYLAIGILESLITVLIITTISKTRPDILTIPKI